MTNGSGDGRTPPSGMPLNGSGGPLNGGREGGGTAVGRGPATAGDSFGAPGAGSESLPAPAAQARRPEGDGGAPGATSPAGGSRGGRLALSNWRVRWRLFAIITVPTVTALVLGVIKNVDANASYNNFARSQELAKLGGWANASVFLLENERDDTAGYISAGRASANLQAQVLSDQGIADKVLSQIQGEAGV